MQRIVLEINEYQQSEIREYYKKVRLWISQSRFKSLRARMFGSGRKFQTYGLFSCAGQNPAISSALRLRYAASSFRRISSAGSNDHRAARS
jgi:hypothetical protein